MVSFRVLFDALLLEVLESGTCILSAFHIKGFTRLDSWNNDTKRNELLYS